MTITPEYQAQLLQMHDNRSAGKKWGTTGARNAGDYITKSIRHRRAWIKSVMDFGAGQGSLGKYVEQQLSFFGEKAVKWTDYDPGRKGLNVMPRDQFDMVVSSDVLEHVEPEMVDEAVELLCDKATRTQVHFIACDPAGLLLPDGRNVHLSCHRLDWWLEKFDKPRWEVMQAHDVLVRKRGMMRRHCIIELDRV